MKVTIIEGPHTDEVRHKCYDYILEIYRSDMKALQEALEAGKTEEEFWKEKLRKGDPNNAEN